MFATPFSILISVKSKYIGSKQYMLLLICKFCWYNQFLTRAQWLTLAQHNLRNAYRAADQQYRSRSRRNKLI
jgi:hypothetical protein